ncbi:response regulator, partial [Bdellovibrionota bacterium FG-2]
RRLQWSKWRRNENRGTKKCNPTKFGGNNTDHLWSHAIKSSAYAPIDTETYLKLLRIYCRTSPDRTEDNSDLLFAMSTLLQSEGYRVQGARDGQEALRWCAAEELPKIVMMDVGLPGLDGYEVCRRLKNDPKTAAKTSSVPVLFLSALSATTDKVRGFEAGGVDFISKPFQIEEVLARVKTHLQLQSLHEALSAAHLFREQIIAGAGEGIVVYDQDLKCRLWNPYMEKMTGLPAAQILGKHPLEVSPFFESARIVGRLERVLVGDKVASQEFVFQRHDREFVWVSCSLTPLFGLKNEVLGVIGVMGDITKRIKEQALLKESEERLVLASRQSQ